MSLILLSPVFRGLIFLTIFLATVVWMPAAEALLRQ